MRQSFRFIAALGLVVVLSSCGNNFLSTQPMDAISLNNFYSTNEQVKASTNILYGAPWFLYNTKFSWAVGDIMSGNGRSWSGDVAPFGHFALTNRGVGGGTSNVLGDGWKSLWTVVAQANALIHNLPKRVAPSVSQSVINHALGEAHVMRALAYFYLVRLWGPVPIIKNNLKHVYNAQVPRIKVEDIYKFIINDLKFGIKYCKQEAHGLYNGGHVTAGSAKALLSKVYLTIENYQKAQQLSQEVINSGEFRLLENYAALFKVKNNNNPETIIALQWSDVSYGLGNAVPAFFSYTTKLTGVGTGWAVIGPTISLQRAYEEGDERLKATIMKAGFHYDDLLSAQGGYTVPKDVNAQGTCAAVKKYVIGTPEDTGHGTSMARENNTYMLRYADVLLINAEAALRNGDQAQALRSINKVRNRAGLPDLTTVTLEDIIHERRVEFAFESQYWYTLKRLDDDKAIQIISHQQRGTYAKCPPQKNPPTIYSDKISPSVITFLLPYPEVAITKNKYFTKPPQSYDFGNDNSSSNQ